MLIASDTFLVSPHVGLLRWLMLAVWLVGAVVTALKGRWGWMFAGLIFGGLIYPFTAVFCVATPDSVWARALYGPDQMAEARQRFPRRLPYAAP
jgi:hypothetical protein